LAIHVGPLLAVAAELLPVADNLQRAIKTAKGGVASAWMLREMAERKLAPLAIIFDRTNTILAQGAAFADMAMVDRFEKGRPTQLIRTGDQLRIEAAAGRVTILNRD